MSVEYKSYVPEIKAKTQNGIQFSLRMFLEDVHYKSQPITPMRYQPLRTSVTKSVVGNTGTIKWNVPYATYQERGRRLNPPYHMVKNYTTPGTQAHFAWEGILYANSRMGKRLLNGV